MIPMTDHKPAWTYSHEYDGGDKACGLLITELAGFFRGLPPGDLVCVVAYDPSAWIDIPAWAGWLVTASWTKLRPTTCCNAVEGLGARNRLKLARSVQRCLDGCQGQE